MAKLDEVYGKMNKDGIVDILEIATNKPVTVIEASFFVRSYNCSLSTLCEHPQGIQLTVEQCQLIKIAVK